MNPLYQQMNKNAQPDIIKQFNQFRQNFKGNPQEQVQSLLNSGKITQAQYDAAVKKANAIRSMFNI